MSNPMLNHIYNYRLLQIVDFIYETTLFIGPLNLRWILILFFSSSSKLLLSDRWWRWPDFKYKGTKSCSVFFGTLKLKQVHACYRRLTYFMCVSHFEKQVLITFFHDSSSDLSNTVHFSVTALTTYLSVCPLHLLSNLNNLIICFNNLVSRKYIPLLRVLFN